VEPQVDAECSVELARLATIARAEFDRPFKAVNEPATPAFDQAVRAMRATLEVAGYSVRHADWAVTAWFYLDRTMPVEDCLNLCTEDGPLPRDPVTGAATVGEDPGPA
jgi:hypothetical protein